MLTKAILMSVINLIAHSIERSLLNILLYIHNRHFFPYGRTNLATTASLQPGWVGTARGSSLQLHGPLLQPL